MKILINERLSEHKYKTPEGYLICVDAILARTGKQEYRRAEVFGDSCDDADSVIEIDRTEEEVFSPATLASFENKPITVEHPDVDVNSDNYKDYAVGFVRDVKRGKTSDGQDVILGTLVITDRQTIEEIEDGEHTDLSCGYDCDIIDENNPQQRNIRGNHVALCAQGRAGIARIVDSDIKDMPAYKDLKKINQDTWLYKDKIEIGRNDQGKPPYYFVSEPRKLDWMYSSNLKDLLDSIDRELRLEDSVEDNNKNVKVCLSKERYAVVSTKEWRHWNDDAYADFTTNEYSKAKAYQDKCRYDTIIIDCYNNNAILDSVNDADINSGKKEIDKHIGKFTTRELLDLINLDEFFEVYSESEKDILRKYAKEKSKDVKIFGYDSVEDDSKVKDAWEGPFVAYGMAAKEEINQAKKDNYYIDYEWDEERFVYRIDKSRDYNGNPKKKDSVKDDYLESLRKLIEKEQPNTKKELREVYKSWARREHHGVMYEDEFRKMCEEFNITDSTNDAYWGPNDNVLTKEDVIKELKTARIQNSEYWDAGDPKKGWYVQIQAPGKTETSMVNGNSGRWSSKESSWAWGRVWRDNQLVVKEEGALNEVRSKMLRKLSSISDSVNDEYNYSELKREIKKRYSSLNTSYSEKEIYDAVVKLHNQKPFMEIYDCMLKVLDNIRNGNYLLDSVKSSKKAKIEKIVNMLAGDSIKDTKVNDTGLGGVYKTPKGEIVFVVSYGSGFSIFTPDGEYFQYCKHLSTEGIKERINTYGLTKIKDNRTEEYVLYMDGFPVAEYNSLEEANKVKKEFEKQNSKNKFTIKKESSYYNNPREIKVKKSSEQMLKEKFGNKWMKGFNKDSKLKDKDYGKYTYEITWTAEGLRGDQITVIPANSEEEAKEKFKRMYPGMKNERVFKNIKQVKDSIKDDYNYCNNRNNKKEYKKEYGSSFKLK